jgi:hypothetical protein
MKAISLWQPWASLMADGRKIWETRHWKGPDSLIGQNVAVHAAKKVDQQACIDFGYDPKTIPRGCVMSVHVLDEYLQFTEENVRGIKDAYGDFSAGRWGWKLVRAKLFDNPIPVIGHQGIWNWQAPWEKS